jgi:hypothetical protein
MEKAQAAFMMTTQTRARTQPLSDQWIAYRAIVWTELVVLCLLVWRAVIMLALSFVR